MKIETRRIEYREPADVCRENGWAVGTVLVGDEGYGLEAVKITAIGERKILGRSIAIEERGGWRCFEHRSEGLWTLDYRDWRPASPDELAAIEGASS